MIVVTPLVCVMSKGDTKQTLFESQGEVVSTPIHSFQIRPFMAV